jgi:hypothetical protein
MLIQRLSNEVGIRIEEGRTQYLRTAQTLPLDGVAYGLRMYAQFTGNGADLPMLGEKIAANLRTDFRTDHKVSSPSSWNRGERVNEAAHAATNLATQTHSRLDPWKARQCRNPGLVRNFYWACFHRPTCR